MKNLLCKVAGLISAIAAINWGLVGLFDFNLVTTIFSTMPQLVKVTYIVFGLAGVIFAGLSVTDK